MSTASAVKLKSFAMTATQPLPSGARGAAQVRSLLPVSGRSSVKQPLLWVVLVMLVMAVALMSFYVHILTAQVKRGESLREAQRSELKQPRNTNNAQRTAASMQAGQR